MKISDRHELLLKALRKSFGSKAFSVREVLATGVWGSDLLIPALEACFGANVMRLKQNLLRIKVGRLFEQKLIGNRFGDYALHLAGRVREVNRYVVAGPPMPGEPRAAPPDPPKPVAIQPRAAPVPATKHVSIPPKSIPPPPGHFQSLGSGPEYKSQPVAPKPVEVVPEVPKPPPRIPKIFDAGRWRPMRPEEIAQHEAPMLAFGIGNGTVQRAGEVSTLWDRSLRNL